MGTHELLVKASGRKSPQVNAASFGMHLAPDNATTAALKLKTSKHDGGLGMPGDNTVGEITDKGTLSSKPLGFSNDHLVDAASGVRGQTAGSMIVFGGESSQGCYLDDVWVLHLNSLMWQELSRPVACQKRCRSMLEQN